MRPVQSVDLAYRAGWEAVEPLDIPLYVGRKLDPDTDSATTSALKWFPDDEELAERWEAETWLLYRAHAGLPSLVPHPYLAKRLPHRAALCAEVMRTRGRADAWVMADEFPRPGGVAEGILPAMAQVVAAGLAAVDPEGFHVLTARLG